MTLIKSISGIRGTIGGVAEENFTPFDIVKYTAAYACLLRQQYKNERLRVVIGRDARVSGKMTNSIVSGTLMSMGIDALDTELSTTPTVEMEVVHQQAHGGIIITASHNPTAWNALKLLNNKGEFLSADQGDMILEIAQENKFSFVSVDKIGQYSIVQDAISRHVTAICNLQQVNRTAIAKADFTIVVDCVNSTGWLALSVLFRALGVEKIYALNSEPTGIFPHNPEPLPEHLTQLSQEVVKCKADVGFAVDPDVDRLAIIDENGKSFGEEYTLVAVADYVLQHQKGNTVSNLSSTQALKVITEQYKGKYEASAVGEVNVVEKMKQNEAVIGGEGNGGIIYPPLHYGRDALVGIALFLSHLSESKSTVSQLRNRYPNFYISKNKIELNDKTNIADLFTRIQEKYSRHRINTSDGVHIGFEHNQWIHLRKSNTEPIIRIYAESDTKEKAETLINEMMNDIQTFTKKQR